MTMNMNGRMKRRSWCPLGLVALPRTSGNDVNRLGTGEAPRSVGVHSLLLLLHFLPQLDELLTGKHQGMLPLHVRMTGIATRAMGG